MVSRGLGCPAPLLRVACIFPLGLDLTTLPLVDVWPVSTLGFERGSTRPQGGVDTSFGQCWVTGGSG